MTKTLTIFAFQIFGSTGICSYFNPDQLKHRLAKAEELPIKSKCFKALPACLQMKSTTAWISSSMRAIAIIF